jgi:hypothetical protein
MMNLRNIYSGGGVLFVVMAVFTVLLNLAMLAGAVWVVVKVLQMMGVLG